MGLFSKLKDYNIELEEVLEKKYFSSNIKNLLLSMIYKLEISYKDFYTVKKWVRNKEEFFSEIVEVIRLYCDNIKTVEPDSDQAKMLIRNNIRALTNENERSILTYPTEMDLLYAVSDISPKYFFINEEFLLKNLLQQSLVNGYNMNNVEILKDFNGWSWSATYNNKFEYIDNLIYQNLLMILGEKFLYEWRTYNSTKRDFLDEAKRFIKIFTNNDKYLKSLYKLVYLNSTGKERELLNEELKKKYKKLKEMNDKIKFIEDSKLKKLKLTKKIEKMDIALNDDKVLQKELDKFNSKLDDKKKIKTLLTYRKMVKKEKEKYMKEITEISYLLIPRNFLSRKRILKDTLDLYKCKDSFDNVLIECQKEFLNFIYKKLSRMSTRDEIIEVLYQIRYYRRIRISNGKSISDLPELANYIDKIQKKAITALCKMGAMRIISMDINLNFEIINYALDTKIIDLEDIKLYFDEDDQGLIIKVFDKDNFEKQGRKKIEISDNILEVRERRKIKLFS